MRAIPAVLFALVFGAAATVPAFGIASVNVFGLKAPEDIEGFTLNDSTNFEKIRPGEGYGLDYSQSISSPVKRAISLSQRRKDAKTQTKPGSAIKRSFFQSVSLRLCAFAGTINR